MRIVLLMIFWMYVATGCTMSIIITDTHGVASDVVDDTATTKTDADLTASIPSAI